MAGASGGAGVFHGDALDCWNGAWGELFFAEEDAEMKDVLEILHTIAQFTDD